MTDLNTELKARVRALLPDDTLLGETVRVRARTLSAEEAIGNPEEDDFPLQKGRERLMEAELLGSRGQAFTDRFGDFEGTLAEILEMPLVNSFRGAVFISTLNALLRHLGRIGATIHCRDREPRRCAGELSAHIAERYGAVKIGQAGFQPRMVEALSADFAMRLLDLDADNIGRRKFGVLVEGPEATAEVVAWADLLLVTGTTLVNGTVELFLTGKPILFFGVTGAGAARLMGWDHFCPCSS